MINIHQKSIEILEKIANSMYDRIPENPSVKWFSSDEVKILEEALKEILEN